MSESETVQGDADRTTLRPLVYIRTLGTIAARVGERVPTLKGNGAGQHQLRRQLGWLVGHCNLPVSWRTLRQVAGGQERTDPLVRPFYMVTGLIQMLRRWSLGAALMQGNKQLTLVPHAAWGTDTDELSALVEAAETAQLLGDMEGALATLERAALHCGHLFLAELVEPLPPTHALRAQASYWTGMQRETLHQLARLCLATGNQVRARQALATAKRVIALDGRGRLDFYLAAETAEACGKPFVAAQYRRDGDNYPT